MDIKDVLDKIVGAGMDLVKREFTDLLNSAKSDAQQLARENAEKAEQWLIQVASGQRSKDDAEYLLRTQKREMEQWLNTVQIEQRTRLARITVGIIDIAREKLLPALLAAIL